ncbi:hypothetical protein DFP72DRAFT_920915 [Ephemerocybe angulata]|uniref:Uncharacterized protein n=1 Tax=Ephemerocybe angulata TaxID=980116 RepID=A0A8H6LY18_9AGAR|nr:hypothetical protein DFP72DRAFT_920915 [Tulosesus angulatus]
MGATDDPSSHGAYNCKKLSVTLRVAQDNRRLTQLEDGGNWRLGRVFPMNGGSQFFAQRPTPVHENHPSTHALHAPNPTTPFAALTLRLALAAGIVTRDTGLRLRRTRPSAAHRDSAPSPSPARNPRPTIDGSRRPTLQLIETCYAKTYSPEPQHDGRRRDDRAATSAPHLPSPTELWASDIDGQRPATVRVRETANESRHSNIWGAEQVIPKRRPKSNREDDEASQVPLTTDPPRRR